MVADEVYKAGKNGKNAPDWQKRAKTHKNFSMHEIAAKDIRAGYLLQVPCYFSSSLRWQHEIAQVMAILENQEDGARIFKV